MPARTIPLAEVLEGVTAVLFDMDGVLLDTEDLYTQATRQVLGPLGDRFDWRIKERMMGRAPLVAAQILIDALDVPMSPQEYLERKRPVLLELFHQSRPKPGAPELVKALAARGLPLAVATSSDRHFFEAKTSHHTWFADFQAIVCGSDAGVLAHKPAPDIFLAAASRLGAAPASCLVFEDAAAGVEAAKRAGVKRIVALADVNIDRSLLADADYLIDSFAELADD
jgi:pseudouridine-5'-monophosphatase